MKFAASQQIRWTVEAVLVAGGLGDGGVILVGIRQKVKVSMGTAANGMQRGLG